MKKLLWLPFINVVSRWFEAANNAIDGIMQAAKTQRHVKFHLLAAFSVLLFCFSLGLSKSEFAVIATGNPAGDRGRDVQFGAGSRG